MALPTRSWIVIAVVALFAVAIGYRQFGTHFTPAGQPGLVHLNAAVLESLRSEFNQAAGEVRVVALLSPT
jgi:hypothetical protein